MALSLLTMECKTFLIGKSADFSDRTIDQITGKKNFKYFHRPVIHLSRQFYSLVHSEEHIIKHYLVYLVHTLENLFGTFVLYVFVFYSL